MEIEKINDELNKEVWRFSIIDNNIYLNEYLILTREDKRKRNWKCLKKYSRLMKRESKIDENDVPFDENIKKQAIDKYIKTINCLKWSERK